MTQISDIFLQRIARIIRIFRRKRRRWPDAEQSEWQEPPRLKNPYNPCNPLWKNTSFSTTNKANNSNLPCGEKMYFPNAASGNEWNRMATLSIRFYSLHPWVHCVLYKFVVFEIFVVEKHFRTFSST